MLFFDGFAFFAEELPLRIADQALYTDYLADALKDWSGNKLAGSIQHGVAVNQPWLASINEAVGLFIGTKDVAALQKALADAAKANAQ